MRSINLQKKNETDIFPVRTKQASSIKFLLLWLYFKFPDGKAHFIGYYYKMRNFFYYAIFPELLPKYLVSQQKKGFSFTSKCFLLNTFSPFEFSSWAAHLSGPCSKIRTAQGTNQIAPFHLGPDQPYNKKMLTTYLNKFLSFSS